MLGGATNTSLRGSRSMRVTQRAGLGLVISLLFAGVGAHAQAPAKKPAADAAIATLRQKMDGAINSALKENRLVGAVVLISRDGKLVYQKAAGFADRDRKQPMKLDTVFRLSSVTKPIVSTAALALIDRGTMKLEDPVTKYLPAFTPRLPNGDVPEITIRELLTHTSSLGYKFQEKADGPYHKAGVSDGFDELRISLDENLKRISKVMLHAEPGSEWRYSVSIDVLGAAIEKATGKPLPVVVAELVTTPLGMKDTAFSTKNASRLAVPYYNAEPAPKPMADPQAVPFGDSELIYSPSRALDDKAFPSGGAGMVGTAPDALKLLEAIRKGGAPVLKPETAAAMMQNQIGGLAGPMPGLGFGFGGAVVVDPDAAKSPQSAGTWMWGGVYGHSWFVDPSRKLTVILLTNTAPEGLMGKVTADVREAVYTSGL
jgi:CubicO group peptidase (beta-lactamase class C family)